MSVLVYRLFQFFFLLGVHLVAPFNGKARRWIAGRRSFPDIPKAPANIWMHCASLGEFEQGRPVLEAIRAKYPDYRVVLSFFSPSGYEIRKNYQGADQVIYLPRDTAANARKLIEMINPSLVIWVKYEYWYNFLRGLHERKVPVLLVSAIFRPSQPFFSWYGGLWIEMLGYFRHLFVQDTASATLLQKIGIGKNVTVSGDTRFDRVAEIASNHTGIEKIRDFTAGKRVLVAGSTWEDDEIELIHYVRLHADKRFIIAPHEIDKDNLHDLKKQFPGSVFYSELEKGDHSSANTLIIDNIGMLSGIYKYADITYIGGGFRKEGIHNILEAAVYGKPVIFGPVYEKFAEARDLVAAGGAFSIENALELERLLDNLFLDGKALETAGKIAGEYVQNKRGATGRVLDYITENRLLTS